MTLEEKAHNASGIFDAEARSCALPEVELSGEQVTQRRVLAVFLPDLLCELARGLFHALHNQKEQPLAVLLTARRADVKASDRLVAVCAKASRWGVCPGLTPAEAQAQLAGLQIEVVEYQQVEARLIALAEMLAQFGTSPSWQMNIQESIQIHKRGAINEPYDTLWIDVTGIGHLYENEENLAAEVAEHIQALGHRVRVSIANGPRLAHAVARFSPRPVHVVPDSDVGKTIAAYPLAALPLDLDQIGWLGRLGIFTVGQLLSLPTHSVAGRLGPRALTILELASGVDRQPLVPGAFPRILVEQSEWEEPAEGITPLLFVLRGLLARIAARLKGRGEACRSLLCQIKHDAAVAKHRNLSAQICLNFEFVTPLYKEADLERVLRSRLESLQLEAPSVGITLQVGQLSPQSKYQLGLGAKGHAQGGGYDLQGGSPAQEFPVLLAELQSDVGLSHVGTLTLGDSLIPEQRSQLQPFSGKTTRVGTNTSPQWINPCPNMDRITRLFPYPQLVDIPLRVGETFALGGELFTIERLQFLQRLGDVSWWRDKAVHRDYHWAWLRSSQGGTEALLYIDRTSGEGFVQALSD